MKQHLLFLTFSQLDKRCFTLVFTVVSYFRLLFQSVALESLEIVQFLTAVLNFVLPILCQGAIQWK